VPAVQDGYGKDIQKTQVNGKDGQKEEQPGKTQFGEGIGSPGNGDDAPQVLTTHLPGQDPGKRQITGLDHIQGAVEAGLDSLGQV